MKLKDFLIKPEEPQQKQPQVSPFTGNASSTPVVNTAALQISTTNEVSSIVENSAVNDNIIKQLFNILIQKNLPGPDYLEVRNSAAALGGMGLTQLQMYEAAFKTLRASYPDFTKEYLLSSIDTYISYIKNEEKTGLAECEEKRKSLIGDKNNKIAELRGHAEDLRQQIQKLTTELNSATQEADAIESTIKDAEAQIEQEKTIFVNSVASVLNTLNTDKDIMSKLNI